MEKNAQAFNLVPEDRMTASLSPAWKARIKKALTYIGDHLSEPLDWDELAHQCAVSPSHFQHMFRVIFNESPGHYVRRMRLKAACYMLNVHPEKTVTDIALDVGFSSSQSLAKALKRDLGVTASEIRDQNYDPKDLSWWELYEKLGAPGERQDIPLEESLAEQISMNIDRLPEQPLHTRRHTGLALKDIDKVWKKMTPKTAEELVMVTFSREIAYEYNETSFYLGYQDEANANQTIAAGWFLNCRVQISSESGYFAAWNAIYRYMLEHKLNWLEDAVMVEVIHNPRAILSPRMDMTLKVALDEDNLKEAGLI